LVKITRRQLRSLIREAVQQYGHDISVTDYISSTRYIDHLAAVQGARDEKTLAGAIYTFLEDLSDDLYEEGRAAMEDARGTSKYTWGMDLIEFADDLTGYLQALSAGQSTGADYAEQIVGHVTSRGI
jgi:hypothetical protein